MNLHVSNLHIEYPDRLLFDSVEMTLSDHEIIAIRSEVLDGGTSLLKGLGGLLNGVAGEVMLAGQNLLDFPPKELRYKIGFVYETQGLVSLFDVYHNIALPLQFHTNHSDREIDRRVRTVCDELSIDEDLFGLRPFELNDVQTRMVNLARALVTDPYMLLIDELEGGMSEEIIRDTMNRLREWQLRSPMVIVITTSSDLVMRMADRVFRIEDHQLEPMSVE
ncbi:MAG: ATP-binding cassette domain-containing protein [Pseudomonadota bacterium]